MKPDSLKQVTGYLTRRPDLLDSRIAGNIKTEKINAADVAKVREEMGLPPAAKKKPGNRGVPRNAKTPQRNAKTLQEFREQHDIAFKIKQGIEKYLAKDSEHYYEDADFRVMLEIPIQNWRRFADSSEFAEYRYRKGNHNLWASKAMKAQIVEILGS